MFSFLRTFTFALVAVAALAGPAAAEPLKLVLLHLNDWDKMESAGKVASVIAAEKKAAEAEGAFVLVTFGGDLISPSLMSGIDKGAHMIELAEQVGIQYATLGNHEFDLGDEVLKARVAESDFTWISSNVTLDGKPFPGVKGPQIIDMNGYKIGLIGLTTPDTTFLASPGPGVAFADYTESATSAAGAVKELGADFVIVLSHGGESLERGLTRSVKDVDLVLGGHDHLARIVYDGRDMTASSGSQGEFIAKTVIEMDKVEKRGKLSLVWKPSFGLVATAGAIPAAQVQAQVDEYTAALDRELGQVIGSTAVELDTRRAAIRSQETAFGNLVADASRAATGADVGLANGGGIRGDTVYPAGTELTRKIILTELSYSPARHEKQRIAALKGAIGCVMMNWGHPENAAVPFGSIKAAWGTPTPESFAAEMPQLPCIGIARSAGLRMKDSLSDGPLRVRMAAKVDNAWRPVQNTIAEIGGSADRELVVAGGHQDSWFGPQATDNASGSACLIELGRVFVRFAEAFRRDLLFGFWTGHETGTMIGSTRFVDRNWDRLRARGAAYLQIDQPSCTGTSEWSTASNVQLRRFHQSVERRHLGNRANRWRRAAKVGDASFFGLGLPMMVGQGAYSEQELKATALASYGWWHHSIHNTQDKIDWDYMGTHIRIYAEWLFDLCSLPVLPFEYVSVVADLSGRLDSLAALSCGLELSETQAAAARLTVAVEALDRAAEDWRRRYAGGETAEEPAALLNDCLRRLGQLLLPAQSTIRGTYGHDPYGLGAQATLIPSLFATAELAELPQDSERRWMLEVSLLRARNSVTDALVDSTAAVGRCLSLLPAR